MIRIKILDIEKHRNETTFRPYLIHSAIFKDLGIEFVLTGNDYDMAWIGQASFIDRKLSYNDSVNWGIDQVNKVRGPKWIFDGQDSASLIGSYDVLLHTDAEFMIKNTMYKDVGAYEKPSILGRIYWDNNKAASSDLIKYIKDFSRFQNIKLSGANWLSTVYPSFLYYEEEKKDIDVFAVFSYPSKKNYEFGFDTSEYYNNHRQPCINWLKSLSSKGVKVAMLPDSGEHISREEYYKLMVRSKILIAPFGYGEIAPRDLEAAMFGCVLIKPDMDHINTIPEYYVSGHTYYSCKWDYSDFEVIMNYVLGNYSNLTIENARNKFASEYSVNKFIRYVHNILSESQHFEV